MRKFTIALLTGGLIVGTAAAASAQDLASAVPAPRGEFMVFSDSGAVLSPTALATIRSAANDARSARQVTLSGPGAEVARVKAELINQGVPAQEIVVQRAASTPLPRTVDGVIDPADRMVRIKI